MFDKKRREFITPLDDAIRCFAGSPRSFSIIGLLRHSARSNRPPNSARARPIRSRRERITDGPPAHDSPIAPQ